MWNLKSVDRLQHWKNFRTELDTQGISEAIKNTVELWNRAPFVPYYLADNLDPPWPNPWELLIENRYCDVAKVLGILYTLYFSKHRDSATFEIRIFRNPKNSQQYNTVWVNGGEYIINFEDDAVVNTAAFDDDLILLFKYDSQDLALDQF